MKHLLSPLTVNGHTLRNRIFSTGHMAVMLKDNLPTKRMVAYHEARARGGAGLIIIEAARAHPSGMSGRPAIRAYDDACIQGYAQIAHACQQHGAKVFAQLTHPGREMTTAADGTQLVALAPSAVPNERFHVMPRPLTMAQITDIVAGFETAAARLRKAGLDGVEVVASHGVLAAQFLNEKVNLRTDVYGGNRANRMRFLSDVLRAVRRGAGPDLVVGVRLSIDEKDHEGLEPDEMIEVSTSLATEDLVDYLNVTAGTSASLAGSTHIVPPMSFETAYTAPLAAEIKARVKVPVFVAGRINQPQIADEVLASGQADMCGMTRALIADPEMPNKTTAGRLDDIRACVACNQACIGHMLGGYPISCIQHPETGRELEFGTLKNTRTKKRVLVVGGGPAGLKAGAIAAERGHSVTLFEAEQYLGGQVRLAQLLPGRAEFGGVTTNLEREARAAGVDVHLATPATLASIADLAPQVVIVATGAVPRDIALAGADEGHVVDAWEVLQGTANVGSSVAIADWRCDWVGLGLAEKLALDGCSVRLAVNGITAGEAIPQYARDAWLGKLHRLGVEVIPYLRPFGIDADSAYFQHTLSNEPVVMEGIDTLVTSLGHASVTSLAVELVDAGFETHAIGDCASPRTVEEAVLEGLKVASAI
ncbi:FAD-dependent oxidoreductase [Sulfitobacter aestuariivivens]|uniref:FAD-dependent oxidoreductase n=1 Tax=Sulfitobacter aestuariivivens TaxID=2766981 RepID=A0A927D8L4_9RHOB|nr:FAD-dependent oxidoreductase [Sulfitobacter aestuariivivens]MBD3666148.1 FAD-dependent oxidoreductase [Sulfitobacter aestuariivivens]